MTTLLLTTSAETGANRLTITPTADIVSVRRTDVNGTYDVRTLTGVLPHPAAGGPLVLDDYEAVHGPATYTVATDAPETLTGTIVLDLDSPWLGTPEAPQFSAPVDSVLDYAAGGSTLSTVFEPDGRPAPIVIVRGASSRRGTLRIAGGTYPAALNLLRLCQRGQTMFLRQTDHPGMDMYFIPTNWDIVTALAAGKGSVFDLSVQYIEVDRPLGALSGSLGWTFAALTAAYPDFAAVSAGYASFGDLRTDVRKP